jgi:class 3 adenylate cyclase
MDLHKGLKGITTDEMKHVHQCDLNVQDKFGVKYHKFWVNEESGTVFCLVEGPNKEACIATHREAHGHEACEIIEVKQSDVALFMGLAGSNEIGRVVHTNGAYDMAIRTFLFTDIVGSTDLTQQVGDDKSIAIVRKHNEIVRSNLIANDGKEVKHTGDGIMACFFSAYKAVNCAWQIQENLKEFRKQNPDFPLYIRIGLNTGEPVTEGGDFFGIAVQIAARICGKADSNQVLVSGIVKDLCMGKGIQFTELGPIELKGILTPITLYEVTRN